MIPLSLSRTGKFQKSRGINFCVWYVVHLGDKIESGIPLEKSSIFWFCCRVLFEMLPILKGNLRVNRVLDLAKNVWKYLFKRWSTFPYQFRYKRHKNNGWNLKFLKKNRIFYIFPVFQNYTWQNWLSLVQYPSTKIPYRIYINGVFRLIKGSLNPINGI